jgi:DNA-binding NarL/FixJ family response regulator
MGDSGLPPDFAYAYRASDMGISTVIVDDEDDIRFLLRLVLAGDTTIDLRGEAANGLEALERIAELEPDVVVLDMRMPGMTGLDVMHELVRRGSAARVVLCSAHMNDALRREAADAGVYRCVSKLDVGAMAATIRDVAALN